MRAKPWEVPDGLWERIEPLLPKKQRRFRYPGRKPLDVHRHLPPSPPLRPPLPHPDGGQKDLGGGQRLVKTAA